MKNTKKTVVTAVLSAITVAGACCLSACNNSAPTTPPTDPKFEVQSLIGQAFQKNIFNDNVTVTTTDTRTNKFGDSIPKLRKLWTEGNEGKEFVDDTNNAEFPSKKYTVARKEGDFVNVKSCVQRMDLVDTENEFNVTPQWDKWNLNDYGGYSEGGHTAAQWIGRCTCGWSSDWIDDCHISTAETGMGYTMDTALYNGDFNYAYTKSTNTIVFSQVYYVQSFNGEVISYHHCTITVKLDTQNRFSQVICNFTNNGTLTSTYQYGNTTVDIHQNILELIEA